MALLAEGRDETLGALWRHRVSLHFVEDYAGIRMSKFPEDLRTYEKVIWERGPRVIVELGVRDGGSTVWLRDRIYDFQRYRGGPAPLVLGVDIDLGPARASFQPLPPEALAGIELLEGDIQLPSTVEAIRRWIPETKRCS